MFVTETWLQDTNGTNKNALQDYTTICTEMLQENVSCSAHHTLLVYLQEKKTHVIEKHEYPGIKLEAVKVHLLKADMSFTVLGIYKAPR